MVARPGSITTAWDVLKAKHVMSIIYYSAITVMYEAGETKSNINPVSYSGMHHDSFCVHCVCVKAFIIMAVYARLLAVSSGLVPGCSIRDDGANFPKEQFEQILQPLAEIEVHYLKVSKLLMKEPHKTQCDCLLILQGLT